MSSPINDDRDRRDAEGRGADVPPYDRDGVDDRDRRPARDYDRDGVDDRDRTPARGHRGAAIDRDTVVEREREAFGGLKIGSAFFGWLSAMGLAVLLTALLAAIGFAVGLGTGTTVDEAADQAQQDPSVVGWASLIGILVVLFVSYYAGGYVAGRMARFDGAKQGLGVWLWALLAAIVVAVLGLVAGDRFNVLAQIGGFPRIPVGEGELTTMGIVAAVLAALVPLVAAVLGGLAGMRYHRAVDDVGVAARRGRA